MKATRQGRYGSQAAMSSSTGEALPQRREEGGDMEGQGNSTGGRGLDSGELPVNKSISNTGADNQEANKEQVSKLPPFHSCNTCERSIPFISFNLLLECETMHCKTCTESGLGSDNIDVRSAACHLGCVDEKNIAKTLAYCCDLWQLLSFLCWWCRRSRRKMATH